MVDTVEELRRMTQRAIAEGRRQREAELRLQREKEDRERREQQLKAQGIIEQIPDRARAEAKNGRDYAVIMGLRNGTDYGIPSNRDRWDALRPEWLKGAAAIVWEHCVYATLAPTLDYWHDGQGMDFGFNIVIHW
jgi:hypothetical protein